MTNAAAAQGCERQTALQTLQRRTDFPDLQIPHSPRPPLARSKQSSAASGQSLKGTESARVLPAGARETRPAGTSPHPARRPPPAHRPADPRLRAPHGARAAPQGRAASRSRVPSSRGREWRRPAPQGQLRVPARGGRPRSPPPPALAAGAEGWKLPQDGPVGEAGGSRAAEQVRRGGGGGYRSALRPIVSLPRGARRSRAREPGSSLARHLPPPLWKRPPPPRAARPGPRLRAAGPARLTGRRQTTPQRPRPPPSWRGPGRPLPGGTCAPLPRSRAPAVRAPARLGNARPGLQVLGAPRREAGAGGQDPEQGFEARKRAALACPAGVSEDGRDAGRSAEYGARAWSPEPAWLFSSFLTHLLTRCQTLDAFLCASVSSSVNWDDNRTCLMGLSWNKRVLGDLKKTLSSEEDLR
uniref:translation initiation factor IF-2 isoform X2 n=1 Tax=Callithrix jacchus TaxID=9483 RepID=UPI0023DD598E|nr:translation initiation factor IF-2 isoform X2 [Callithrix jacchus]